MQGDVPLVRTSEEYQRGYRKGVLAGLSVAMDKIRGAVELQTAVDRLVEISAPCPQPNPTTARSGATTATPPSTSPGSHPSSTPVPSASGADTPPPPAPDDGFEKAAREFDECSVTFVPAQGAVTQVAIFAPKIDRAIRAIAAARVEIVRLRAALNGMGENYAAADAALAESKLVNAALESALREERAFADRAPALMMCHYGYRAPCIEGQNVLCGACQFKLDHKNRRASPGVPS